MFQKGRAEQEIKYRAEVLKLYPGAKCEFVRSGSFNMCAIWHNNKRISEPEKVAWKAWESAYYAHLNKTDLFQY